MFLNLEVIDQIFDILLSEIFDCLDTRLDDFFNEEVGRKFIELLTFIAVLEDVLHDLLHTLIA